MAVFLELDWGIGSKRGSIVCKWKDDLESKRVRVAVVLVFSRPEEFKVLLGIIAFSCNTHSTF